MKHNRQVILSALALSLFLTVSDATADALKGVNLLKDASREITKYYVDVDRTSELLTPHGRTVFVSHVHRYCLGLENIVPKNSPAEEEWLKSERSSGNSDRIMRARISVEWARQRMAWLIDDCLQWVDVFQEADRGTSQYVIGKTGALIELGRAFAVHLPFAQEYVDTLGGDKLMLHTVDARVIADLSLFAAHRNLSD